MAARSELDDQIKQHRAVNALTAERCRPRRSPTADQLADKLAGLGDVRQVAARRRREGLAEERRSRIRNTMSTTTGSQGGFTVQTEVAKQVLDALKLFGGMRAVAEVFQTAMGNPISISRPRTAPPRPAKSSRRTPPRPRRSDVRSITLTTYKYSSKIVAVPFELLQDSQIDVEAFVRGRLVTRLGRITNTKFTPARRRLERAERHHHGGRHRRHRGQRHQPGHGDHLQQLIDLVHSVDPAYRALGNCRFMMNDSVVKVIRKIVDGQSRPIFNPGWTFGSRPAVPRRRAGSPARLSDPDQPGRCRDGGVAKSIAFGDFSTTRSAT
jgi:HK97 family phage major capsid protein